MLGQRKQMTAIEAADIAAKTPETLGAFLYAQMTEAFTKTLTGIMASETKVGVADLIDIGKFWMGMEGAERPTSLDADTWSKSEYFREGIEWEGGSPAKARIYAEEYDEMKARQEIIARKPEGALATTLGFGAALVGSLPDPVNLIPFGAVVKGGKAAHMVGRAMLEGAAGNLATSAISRPYWDKRGDESEWQDYVLDTVMGAAIGGAFGAAGVAVRALRGRVSSADKAAMSTAVEATINGDNPGSIQGVAEATSRAREAAGLDPEVRFVEEPDLPPVERFEPMARNEQDPDGLLAFVSDEEIATVQGRIDSGEIKLSEADKMAFDEVRAAEDAATKAEEAYARAVECIV